MSFSFKGTHEFTVAEEPHRTNDSLGYMARFVPPLSEEEIMRFSINGDGTEAIHAARGEGYDRIWMTSNFARKLAMEHQVQNPDSEGSVNAGIGSVGFKVRVGVRILEILSFKED